MAYTVFGALVGGTLSYTFGKINKVSDAHDTFFPSNMECLVFTGTVLGGATGFGVGVGRLTSGRYLGSYTKTVTDKINKIIKGEKGNK